MESLPRFIFQLMRSLWSREWNAKGVVIRLWLGMMVKQIDSQIKTKLELISESCEYHKRVFWRKSTLCGFSEQYFC